MLSKRCCGHIVYLTAMNLCLIAGCRSVPKHNWKTDPSSIHSSTTAPTKLIGPSTLGQLNPDRNSKVQQAAYVSIVNESPEVTLEESSTKLADLAALGLDELIAIAQRQNPVIQQAEAALSKGWGYRRQVSLSPNPMVGYSGSQLADRQTAQHTVFVGQEYVTSQKLELNDSVFQFEIESLKWRVELQRRSVVSDVKQQYFEVLGATKSAELTGQFVELANKAAALTQQKAKAGEATQVEVLQSEVQLQQLRVVQMQANS